MHYFIGEDLDSGHVGSKNRAFGYSLVGEILVVESHHFNLVEFDQEGQLLRGLPFRRVVVDDEADLDLVVEDIFIVFQRAQGNH